MIVVLDKIVASEKQRQVAIFRDCVGEAIAEIQLSRMSGALAEACLPLLRPISATRRADSTELETVVLPVSSTQSKSPRPTCRSNAASTRQLAGYDQRRLARSANFRAVAIRSALKIAMSRRINAIRVIQRRRLIGSSSSPKIESISSSISSQLSFGSSG